MKLHPLLCIQWILIIHLSVWIPASAQVPAIKNHQEVLLWPGIPPGSENVNLEDVVQERSTDTLIKNRKINNIGAPSIAAYLPNVPNGSVVLICPGGGYTNLSYDLEGVEIAQWLNSKGFTAFILKYRLPAEGHINGSNVPLMDAQRAMRLIRSNAKEWQIDSAKIGVIGFSAGGHLASSLGTLYDKKVYDQIEKTDQISARPDFMILIYPVISMEDSLTHKGSKKRLLGKSPDKSAVRNYSTNLQITPNTPPTFIVHANDDKTVVPENSLLFYNALNASGVSAELHIFQQGGHGFGIRKAKGPLSNWTMLCEKWLAWNGFK